MAKRGGLFAAELYSDEIDNSDDDGVAAAKISSPPLVGPARLPPLATVSSFQVSNVSLTLRFI